MYYLILKYKDIKNKYHQKDDIYYFQKEVINCQEWDLNPCGLLQQMTKKINQVFLSLPP